MARKRVLIVDDREIISVFLKHSLEAMEPQYEVVTASSGVGAVEQLQQQRFDVVVTAYELKDVNVRELARTVRQRSPETPVVLMMASEATYPGQTVESLGFDGYIDKPFTLAQLARIIDKVTAGSVLAQQR